MHTVAEIIRHSKAYHCLDCGKCTSICPVARVNRSYSPRSLLMRCVQKDHVSVLKDRSLWDCLTCGLCELRCPSQIRYIEFMRNIRQLAIMDGVRAECSHGGAFQSLNRIMTAANLKQNRMDWLTADLKISQKGDYLYFVGCAPYFDVFFSELNVDSLQSVKGTVKLLNKMGVNPIILEDERCCGHDMLWSGDFDNFKKLGEHNLKLIRESGAKTVVLSCPEGYQIFSQSYPQFFGNLGFKVVHISQLMSEKIQSREIVFEAMEKVVTFQDPCRLGRHTGIYDEPRQLLNAIPGISLNEMVKNRRRSICCGVGNWLTCGSTAKTIQANRFREAKQVEADVLITACPKCEIHYKCALQDKKLKDEVQLEVKDLITLAAEVLAK
ncbi:MAG TPA: (Fe-S)-binding protein [bacterium]|nr:(Fe-S)-binding protein [bacterium]